MQVDALASNPTNSKLAERVAYLWRCFAHINGAYIRLKNGVCLPQLGGYIPGHQAAHIAHNERMLKLQAAVEAVLPAAVGAAAPVHAKGVKGSSQPECKPAGPVAEGLEVAGSDLATYSGSTNYEKLQEAVKQNQ